MPDEVYRGQCSIKIPKWQAWAKHAKEKLDELMTAAACTPARALQQQGRRALGFLSPTSSIAGRRTYGDGEAGGRA